MRSNYYFWMKCGWRIYPTKSPICGGRTGRGSPGGFRDCYLAQCPSLFCTPGVVTRVNGLRPPYLKLLGFHTGWGCPHGQAFADREQNGNLGVAGSKSQPCWEGGHPLLHSCNPLGTWASLAEVWVGDGRRGWVGMGEEAKGGAGGGGGCLGVGSVGGGDKERSLWSASRGVADRFPKPRQLVLGGRRTQGWYLTLGLVLNAGACIHPTSLLHHSRVVPEPCHWGLCTQHPAHGQGWGVLGMGHGVPKALLPKGKRPGCLPTGKGKRAGLCVLCARRA